MPKVMRASLLSRPRNVAERFPCPDAGKPRVVWAIPGLDLACGVAKPKRWTRPVVPPKPKIVIGDGYACRKDLSPQPAAHALPEAFASLALPFRVSPPAPLARIQDMSEAVEAWRTQIGILRPSQARLERLGEWYTAEHERLVRFAYVLTRDTQAAEDLVQEAFVRMYRAGARAEEPGFPAYARRTLLNLANSQRRRRAIERRALSRMAAGACGRHEPDHSASVDIRQALMQLSIADRACLALRYFEGLSDREIAATLGISDAAASKRIERAHTRLRAMLEEEQS